MASGGNQNAVSEQKNMKKNSGSGLFNLVRQVAVTKDKKTNIGGANSMSQSSKKGSH